MKVSNRCLTYILFLLFSISACFSSFIDEPVHYIDPRLEYYYDMFLEDGLMRGHDYTTEKIILELSHLKSNEAGIYFDRKNNINHIVINEEFYNSHHEDTALVTLIVYHELGHALLKKRHKHDNCQHVMYKYTSTCTVFKFRHNQKSMIDELFFGDTL